MRQDEQYVYIPDEDGNDVKFKVITNLEIEEINGKYIIATPDFEETDEAYAFKIYKDEDGSDLFVSLDEDDEEFKMVSEAYNTIEEDGLL